MNNKKDIKSYNLTELKKEIEKVLVASGETNLNVPEDLDGMSKLLSDRQQILASLVPAGGVSVPASGKNGMEKLVCGYTEEQLKAFQVKIKKKEN